MQLSIAVRAVALVFIGGAIGGCAFGQKIAYSDSVADVDAQGDKSVAIATLDERPYVLNGNKKPSFVGLSRGGYGNPFDVETPSGSRLSGEISQSVSRSLSERGFKTSVVQKNRARGEKRRSMRWRRRAPSAASASR